MAQSNHERIGKALEALTAGLKPFVERELKSEYQDQWFAETRRTLGTSQLQLLGQEDAPQWDAASLLMTLWNQWNEVFRKILGHAERSLVSELREVRNQWAHQRPFSTDDAYRAIDSMQRLLEAVSAGPEAEDLGRSKSELLRLKFDEQARHDRRKAAGAALETQVATGLKPWREVVMPHPDVASGKYQQAEFAADLWQVSQNQGTEEYRNPMEFFRRTYLTAGLKDLLVRALARLSGSGGDPVVELQTNFGGGKTHSMLALYHLFSGASKADLPGLEPVFSEAKADIPQKIRRAVLVGNRISPGQPDQKEDGTVVHTLWGELAWQLGGKEGYALIKEADKTSTNPGKILGTLFQQFGPCLILIDEWVAYARQLHETNDLPAGDFETQFTFAQALSEEVKSASGVLLVVSLPASSEGSGASPTAGVHDEEVGGSKGREALARLRNVFQRIATQWRPASPEESYEIVRRRLFQPITDSQLFVARDRVAKEFCDLYRTQHQEFPPECREGDYERKIKAAYPIHPEIFDRLYQDWSGLVKFQRTRGVLRLMAAVIHALWERNDQSPIILPASLTLDDPQVHSELTRYLPNGWDTVVDKDVDGVGSLPLNIDREKPNLGRYSATRRVARTVFLGSAPTQQAANKGIEDRRIKLGCVQPGESSAVFADALGHLSRAATYLYVDGNRYWYSTQPTVTKLADDRAEQLNRDPDKVADEVRRRVREDVKRNKGEFGKIHAFPSGSGDWPTDEQEARLVVLDVDCPFSKEIENLALLRAADILEKRGNSPRLYRNGLVFLAADRARLEELSQAVRYFLAWKSIEDEKVELNLDNHQSKQAATQCNSWDRTVNGRIFETFQWLLIPTQTDPSAPMGWSHSRLTARDPLAVRVSKKLRNDGQLAGLYAPSLLRQDLDRVPLWRGNHVEVRQLVEDYSRYLYLQRLTSPSVLVRSIQDGINLTTWESDSFAFADSFDGEKKRYVGIRAGKFLELTEDSTGLLVKAEVASVQLARETPRGQPAPVPGESPDGGDPVHPPGEVPTGGGPQPPQSPKTVIRRFHGAVKLDPTRLGRDAGRIAEEVIQHLALLEGAEIELVLDIHAELPTSPSENTIRTVSENCNTLKFDSAEFEKE